MSDTEDRQNAGTDAGPEPHIPACDLARRRVAAILRRARPMQDQEWTRLRRLEETCRMHETIPERFGALFFPECKISFFNLIGAVPIYRVVKLEVRVSKAWKNNAANFNSRFVKSPRRDPEAR
jgi:hypothetical protein